MNGKVIMFVAIGVTLLIAMGHCSPAIDSAGDMDYLGVCIRNCALCKKMYGPYFEGQMCAEACIKFKGKMIPDCEDIGSIGPFINKLA